MKAFRDSGKGLGGIHIITVQITLDFLDQFQKRRKPERKKGKSPVKSG